MTRFLYNLLWPIGLVLFLPGYLRKMFRRGGYRHKFGQRFAIYDRKTRGNLAPGTRLIWVHAVSVGEVAVALKLIHSIAASDPLAKVALTTTTTTGFAFAEKNAPAAVEVLYSPLDFWPVMHRAFSVLRPERILLVEAEVWPNLMAEARSRRIPVALVNARLSPRTERRFTKFRSVVSPLLRQVDLICVPEPIDVGRWLALGVDRNRIQHTGSIKFDPTEIAPADTADLGAPFAVVRAAARTVLFGGSTHRGEEEILARIFGRLRQEFADLLLFLAPRHVERAREVKKQIAAQSLGVSLCSELNAMSKLDADCVVLDRTGELREWYQIASVVFVGKSLTAIGGQNPVEPILANKPVVFGQHMENFAALARELVANAGAIEVADEQALEVAVKKLLSDPEARLRLVQNARRIIDAHRGATRRTAELVLRLQKQTG